LPLTKNFLSPCHANRKTGCAGPTDDQPIGPAGTRAQESVFPILKTTLDQLPHPRADKKDQRSVVDVGIEQSKQPMSTIRAVRIPTENQSPGQQQQGRQDLQRQIRQVSAAALPIVASPNGDEVGVPLQPIDLNRNGF